MWQKEHVNKLQKHVRMEFLFEVMKRSGIR